MKVQSLPQTLIEGRVDEMANGTVRCINSTIVDWFQLMPFYISYIVNY